MTKMNVMSVYGKNHIKSSVKSEVDDLETWYIALDTLVLPSLFKCCPMVDLDIFYGNVIVLALSHTKAYLRK